MNLPSCQTFLPIDFTFKNVNCCLLLGEGSSMRASCKSQPNALANVVTMIAQSVQLTREEVCLKKLPNRK